MTDDDHTVGAKIDAEGRPPLQPLELTPESESWRYSIVKDGRALNLFGVLAHHPAALRAYARLGGVIARNTIPPAVTEFVILRVAARNRCSYEIARHRMACRALEIPDDVVEAVLDLDLDPAAIGRDVRERVVIELVDELERSSDVSDDIWARVRQTFAADEIVGLLMLIGTYRTTAYILNAARVPLDPDVRPPPD
jgi:alkylhydroperoxidase family enzyme